MLQLLASNNTTETANAFESLLNVIFSNSTILTFVASIFINTTPNFIFKRS